MRVSVVNFCTAALDMLDFSTRMIVENAGTDDYDYLLVTFRPTPEVLAWVAEHPFVRHHSFDVPANWTNGYVPALRAMMNYGYDLGYALNDYVVLVNTDMAFGRKWLENLVLRATVDVIPNPLHITPVAFKWAVHANLGIPTDATFDMEGFWRLHGELCSEKTVSDRETGNWEKCSTFPYALHRGWWTRCGPWKLHHPDEGFAPDLAFLRRCHRAGAEFLLCHDSIVYHHEAVERNAVRPTGLERMANEPTPRQRSRLCR